MAKNIGCSGLKVKGGLGDSVQRPTETFTQTISVSVS